MKIEDEEFVSLREDTGKNKNIFWMKTKRV